MNWHAALITKLKASSGVTALAADRFHANEIPRGAIFPALRFYLVTSLPVSTKDAVTTNDEVYVQIDACSEDLLEAINLSKAVVSALDRAAFGTVTLSRLVRQSDGYDPENKFHVVGSEFQFWTTR